MAAGGEIMGSRQEVAENKITHGIELWVSDDNSTNKPAIGGFFTPGPDGSSIESGLFGRKCVRVKTDTEVFPGLFLHTAFFSALVAYA
jgi:hypothetical protein